MEREPQKYYPQTEENTFESFKVSSPVEESKDIMGVEVKEPIEVRTLEKPRFSKEPFLQELEVGEVNEIPIYSYPQLDFELSPNVNLGKNLNSILDASSKTEVFVRLALIAGGTPALWSLLTKGISTGLSGGTMDIIYRIGVPSKVHGLLDNVDIAVGSLQRRLQIGNIMAEKLKDSEVQRVVSIAGGSCLIPIEAIYQSQKYGVQVVNVDYSPKANQKAEEIIDLGKKTSDMGIGIRYLPSDILNEGIPEEIESPKPQVFECTGFWEYLNPSDRGKLLEKISGALKKTDTFVLTALVNNSQQELFDKMGFKKLNPQPLEEYIEQVKGSGMNIEKVYLTPNKTYATVVVSG